MKRKTAPYVCTSCYKKALRAGTHRALALPNRGPAVIPLADKLERHTNMTETCWLWTGPVNNAGYGMVHHVGEGLMAHRVSYERARGPIPPGLVLDHLCRVPLCVNPDHLEPVTSRENVLRSPISMAAKWAARTHCQNGHEFTEENTAWRQYGRAKRPYRQCRACRRVGRKAVAS